MAIRSHTPGGPSGLPYNLLSQAIHRLTRAELEDLTQSLIDTLDALDGDPDFEECDLEDSFVLPVWCGKTYGLGCPFSDPGGQCDEDDYNTNLAVVLRQAAAGCIFFDDEDRDENAPVTSDANAEIQEQDGWRERTPISGSTPA